MSDLDIKPLKIEEARELITPFDITLKRDGTLMYWKEGKLISPRGIVRNDRYSHIARLLSLNGVKECIGEMYIEGGNVFDISSKENWGRAKYMIFDLEGGDLDSIKSLVKKINSPSITTPIQFKSLAEGWEFVLKNKEEGLVLRNPLEWYKVKLLQESKVRILGWEEGKSKGAFILEGNNKVSGTKEEFVREWAEGNKEGKIVMAEIEYPFITKEGHFFQPRLRRVYMEE